MKWKLGLKISLGIIGLALIAKLLMIVIVEPWVEKKIESALDDTKGDYVIKIERVHIRLITSGLVVDNITLSTRKGHEASGNLNGRIESVKLKGINIVKTMFKGKIDIDEVVVSNISIKGTINISGKSGFRNVSPKDMQIGKLSVHSIELGVKNSVNTQAVSVKEGEVVLYDINVTKNDTITFGAIGKMDFSANALLAVSPDSNYTYKATGISYSGSSNMLASDSLFIQPNYDNYEFAARFKLEQDRIDAGFFNVAIHDISALTYLSTGSLMFSSLIIGEMDVKVFRDKRKEDRHERIPAFQELIYNYPGHINIDSICLTRGNVTYTEHAEKASGPGRISFKDINARIYNITNDTIYRTAEGYLEVKGNALLMGKGKLTLSLKSKLFDDQNTFSLTGNVSDMEVSELNPMLENNAFVYATSGKLDEMKFSFTANNTKASGSLTMLYHGLVLAMKNKKSDDTTAVIERVKSNIANRKVLESNPIAGKAIRVGTIEYFRRTDRFLFNYCFKSIFSGVKTSLVKPSRKKSNP